MLKKKRKKIKKTEKFYEEVQKEIEEKESATYDIEDQQYLKEKLIQIEFEEENKYDLKKSKYLNHIKIMFSKRRFAKNFMICFVIFIGIFFIFLLTSIRNTEYKSFQYQEDMILNLGKLNLNYATYDEELNNINLDFNASIKATESNNSKRPYMIIKSFDKRNNQYILYEDWYNPYENEDIDIEVDKSNYKQLEGLIIEIYEIRDKKELDSELTKYIEGAVIFKEDFRIYEDLSNFFEEDKAREEVKKEDQYIYKILYSKNNISRFDEETMNKINYIYSKGANKIHNILEEYIKKINEILQNEKQVLIDLGITEEEWNVWEEQQKDNEFVDFVDELEDLKSEYANGSID